MYKYILTLGIVSTFSFLKLFKTPKRFAPHRSLCYSKDNLNHFLFFTREVNNMANKAIHTENAPAALGPYSQAIQAGNTIYVSGQLGIDPATGALAGDDAVIQAKQSLTNIGNILKEAGASMSDVVTVTVLLDDISAFAEVNKVYAEFFAEPYPARACYEVAKLPANALIEIQVTAVIA
jgi:2-iminobutanoate/2-iminopropanoate deaminase